MYRIIGKHPFHHLLVPLQHHVKLSAIFSGFALEPDRGNYECEEDDRHDQDIFRYTVVHLHVLR